MNGSPITQPLGTIVRLRRECIGAITREHASSRRSSDWVLLALLYTIASCDANHHGEVATITPVFLGTGTPELRVTFPAAERQFALDVGGLKVPGLFANGSQTMIVEDSAGPVARVHVDQGEHILALVSSTFMIRRGTHLGSEVPVAALLNPEAPSLLSHRVLLWSEFPVTVSMANHDSIGPGTCSPQVLSTSNVREAIATLNRVVGTEVLRFEQSGSSCLSNTMVTVQRVTGAGWLGRTSLATAPCSPQRAADSGCHPVRITSAHVQLDARASLEDTVHELLHVLGLGHTCLVPSAMGSEFSKPELLMCGTARYELGMYEPLVLARGLSAYDIAGVTLLYRLSKALGRTSGRSFTWIVYK